jgi:hypothetical protein
MTINEREPVVILRQKELHFQRGGNVLKNRENSPKGLYVHITINDLIVSTHPDICQYRCLVRRIHPWRWKSKGKYGKCLRISVKITY